MWVARAECRPLGGHALKTREKGIHPARWGWGNLLKEVTLRWAVRVGRWDLA